MRIHACVTLIIADKLPFYLVLVFGPRSKLFKTHHGDQILKDKTVTPAPTPSAASMGITETAVGAASGAQPARSQQQALFNSLMFSKGNKP